MRNNELFKLIIETIKTKVIELGYTNIEIFQQYQPTQQGQVKLGEDKGIYIYRFSDIRYGSNASNYRYNDLNRDFDKEYEFLRVVTYRINVRVKTIPSKPTDITAIDFANLVADCLQFDEALALFSKQNFGVRKIAALTDGYYLNEQARYESIPGFNAIFDYTDSYELTVPRVTELTGETHRV